MLNSSLVASCLLRWSRWWCLIVVSMVGMMSISSCNWYSRVRIALCGVAKIRESVSECCPNIVGGGPCFRGIRSFDVKVGLSCTIVCSNCAARFVDVV